MELGCSCLGFSVRQQQSCMSYDAIKSSYRRFLIQTALQWRWVPSPPETVSPVAPLLPFPLPRTTVSPLPVREGAGILQEAPPWCVTEEASSTAVTSSLVVSISKSGSDQLSCFQNILWTGSVTSLSCLHLHFGLLSIPSLSSGKIFHLCYHLPVVFSHYPLVHSKCFQSFQLSFCSLGKVFCVTLIIPGQE